MLGVCPLSWSRCMLRFAKAAVYDRAFSFFIDVSGVPELRGRNASDVVREIGVMTDKQLSHLALLSLSLRKQGQFVTRS